MDLSDPQAADSLMSHLEQGGTFTTFAQAYDVRAKTVSRQVAACGLGDRVFDARMRGRMIDQRSAKVIALAPVVGHQAEGRPSTRGPVVTVGHQREGALSRDDFLEKLELVYNDDKHPHWHHAARMLGAWHLEPEMVRRRLAAEAEGLPALGPGTLPVVVALPSVDRARERGVIDAEVVS